MTEDPFPPRIQPAYRADAIDEEYAFLRAYPPPTGGDWTVVSQQLRLTGAEPVDLMTVRADTGAERTVPFAVGSFYGAMPGTAVVNAAVNATADAIEQVMQQALDFARENPPHHPGSMPRFPIPSAGYPGRVDVPLALVAADSSRRPGFFAPPRVAVMTYPAAAPVGVGEFPGFDPGHWPPPRLGDWPPVDLRTFGQGRMAATIARFSCCWHRLLTAWLASNDYPHRRDESAEALALLTVLDPPPMREVYEQLNPRFWHWLHNA